VNSAVLIAGGYDGMHTVLTEAELYDPVAGTFAATMGRMVEPRSAGVATLLGTGEVLLAGGCGATYLNGNCTYLQWNAELYDPGMGTFTATGSMTTARGAPAATLLDSGMVLVTGGATNTTTYTSTASADLYDPSTKTFAATVPMTVRRHDPTATLLRSGEVLVAGGGVDLVPQASAELFDPDGGTSVDAGAADSGEDAADAGTDSSDGAVDAGTDSGRTGVDSGAGGKDSGTLGEDSGPPGDGGQSAPSQSGGCGCRTAPREDVPSYALLFLAAASVMGIRRRARKA